MTPEEFFPKSKNEPTTDIPSTIKSQRIIIGSQRIVIKSMMNIFCLNCCHHNKDTAKFCEQCGEKVFSFIEPEMVYIDGGTFQMGDNNGYDNEKPVHSVTVNNFYMCKYPVTNKEYCLYNVSRAKFSFDKYFPNNPGNNLPAVYISWDNAVAYCQWLSNKTGKNYRLPTEAEWEYACRAGTNTNYYWGDKMDDSYCWYDKNSNDQVHPVGQNKSNDWELYDMSGNVWEWCNDRYDENYYSVSPSDNPTGPTSGMFRVLRGGSFGSSDSVCRSVFRFMNSPTTSFNALSFRLVRSL